jgi:DtxR family Mn-dependent transcriptional regulator
LWEKYLADETSVKETDWHTSAEEQEHKISNEEAEKLAARIGNPVFDPHGDPIPTSTGDLPEVKWKLLTELKLYDIAKIVHIEDEPRTIYSQIVAEGLYPGTQLQITDISNERIKFEADGNECILAPVFAANISVVPIEKKEEFQKSFQTLSALSIGEKGKVIGISQACRGQQRRRLMDLGIVPGSVISVELKSLTGDPTAYKIRGATVALRKEQSNNIFIEDVKEESEI